jgi:integrase
MPHKRGSTWVIEWTDVGGKRRREATKATTKKEAETLEALERVRVERQRRGFEPASRNPSGHTVRTLVDWACVKRKRSKNAYSLEKTLKAHVVGDFALLPLDLVTPASVRVWLDERQAAAGISDGTTNRLRAYLSGVFRLAIEHGQAVDNPVRSTRPRQVEAPAPRAFAAHLVPLLLSEVPKGWRLPVAMAAYAGLRRSEIERLEWANVDLDLGVLYVVKTKTSRPRVVPIHTELRRHMGEAGRGRVVPKAWWGHSATIVRDALERCGVDAAGATFHGLRHVWASQWVACGARADLVELVGWGPRSGSVMQRHYLQVPVEVLRSEMAKLTYPDEPPGKVLPLEKPAQIRHIKGATK